MNPSASSPRRIAIAGAGGRMGRMLIEAVVRSPDMQLAAALDLPNSPQLGTDAGLFLGQPVGVVVSSDITAGLLTRSQFESGKAVYELNEGQHHDHLVCLDCGRVEEFFDEEIEKRQHAIARAKGFEIADHALSLYAHCTRKPCPFKNT